MLDSSIAVVSPPNIPGKSRTPINAVPIEYPKFLSIQKSSCVGFLIISGAEMVRLVNSESKRPISIPNTTVPGIISTVWVYRLNDPPKMNVPNAETINPPINMYLDPNLD